MITHFGSTNDLPIRLYPTALCNFNCLTPLSTKFCDHIYNKVPHLPADDFIEICKIFKKYNLAKIVKVSGKEPTLYPEVIELIRGLKPFFETITFSTNGTADLSLIKDAVSAGVKIITITIPTLDKEKYIHYTGLSRAVALRQYNHLMQLVMLIKELPVELHINCVIMANFNDDEYNIDNLLNFGKLNGAVVKVFDLNYHPSINKHYLNGNVLFEDSFNTWKTIYSDLSFWKDKWKAEAVKIETYKSNFSKRIVFQLKFPGGTQVIFDEYESTNNQSKICIGCPFKKGCREGPYANGWEIYPDMKILPCPIRHDLAMDLKEPKKIKKLFFEDGELKIVR